MSDKIVIPALGESITEATIVKLLKKNGDSVKVDDVILELETEKVNLEVSAQTAGIIEGLNKKEGDTVSVGDIVGNINSKGSAQTSTSSASNAQKNSAVQTKVSSGDIDTRVTDTAPVASERAATNQNVSNVPSINFIEHYPPSVNKLLTENNLDPKNISGSGKRGMLTKGDVLEHIANPSVDTNTKNIVNQPIISDKVDKDRPEERVKMSRLRQTIAKRLKDSQNTAAILTTFNEINMSKVMQLRTTYKETFEKKYNTKLGFMSFFVKAVVDALQAIPAINAEIQGDEIIYKNYYDIGVAVGGPQGLVVPVLRNCKNLTFAQIESEIINYSNKAKTGKLAMEDLTGGTFTISNGGVYGSLLSTPIINPPQSGILGLHKIEERPIVVSGKVEIQPMMYVALSYDHRIIDGQDAVKFLVKVKENIENPERLLLNV